MPLCNPREGGCAGADNLTTWRHGQTARGGGARKTLNPVRPTQVETLLSQTKPHARGGPGTMYLYYNTFSNGPHGNNP
jgi:hypothetical protein